MSRSLHSQESAATLSQIPREICRSVAADAFRPLLSLLRSALPARECELHLLDSGGSWHRFGRSPQGEGEGTFAWRSEDLLRSGKPLVDENRAAIPLAGDGTLPGVLLLDGVRPGEWSKREGEILFQFIEAIAGSLRDKLYRIEVTTHSRANVADPSVEHYRNFYENAIEGFYQTTILGNYLRANLALARMYGYGSVDELINHSNFTARSLYVEKGRREAFVEAVSQTDSINRFESKVYRRDGSTMWISESARAIRDEAGLILFFEGTVTDITRQKEAEIALLASRRDLEERIAARTLELREQMARFNRLIGNVPGMVYQFEVSEEGLTRLTYVSEGVRDFYGLTPVRALANRGSLADLIHPEDAASYRASIEHSIATLEPWHWVGRVRAPKGESKWIHGKARPARDAKSKTIRSEEGNVVWDGIVIDVTELQEMKLELRRSLQQSSTILEISPDGILTVDDRGIILGVNPAAENMLGSFGNTVVGRGMGELFLDLHGSHGDGSDPNLFSHIATSPFVGRRSELTGLRADGTPFPVEMTLSPIDSGEHPTFTVNLRDISSRKRFEKRLRDSRDEAQRASLAKSEFLSRMSHELRTPLNAILGFSQLLVRAEDDPAQSEKLIFIQRAGKHLLDLINEVLDLARIEAGKLCCSIEEVSMRSVIEEIAAYARPLALENRISLDLGPELPDDFIVLADQQRLKQILLNLVANAIKYNRPDGTVRVRCELSGPGHLSVAVEDTGPGMSEEQVQILFTPFDRLGADTSKSVGTGIGLALSQSLAELMGSRIEVETRLGAGSRFSLRLPRPGAEVPSVATPEEEGGIRPLEIAPSLSPAKKSLLYIEDNPLNLRLIREVVKESGRWQLDFAETGEEGLRKAAATRPEMILLDVHLPDLNGDKILKRLRRDHLFDETYIAILTADAMGDGEALFRGLGADCFLTKPIDILAILDLLEEVATRETGLAG